MKYCKNFFRIKDLEFLAELLEIIKQETESFCGIDIPNKKKKQTNELLIKLRKYHLFILQFREKVFKYEGKLAKNFSLIEFRTNLLKEVLDLKCQSEVLRSVKRGKLGGQTFDNL